MKWPESCFLKKERKYFCRLILIILVMKSSLLANKSSIKTSMSLNVAIPLFCDYAMACDFLFYIIDI